MFMCTITIPGYLVCDRSVLICILNVLSPCICLVVTLSICLVLMLVECWEKPTMTDCM